MKEEVIKSLYEPFELRERQGLGGMKFKYASSTDIIDRMNKTFGGNWSTNVVSQERVDNFVIVRVCVSVLDPETGKLFSHDGYGSGMIARYGEGQKAGQVIDLGNAYKSAEAKAIKNACTRWGVGLYLESTPDDDDAGPFTAHTGGGSSFTGHKNQTPSTKQNTIPPPFPPKNVMGSTDKPKPAVVEVPKTISTKTDVKQETVKVEKTPVTHVETTPVTEKHDITDVQKVAVQGLLQIKKLKFDTLVAEALGRTDNLPKKIEDLNYQDAVTVIKYGNDIDKK